MYVCTYLNIFEMFVLFLRNYPIFPEFFRERESLDLPEWEGPHVARHWTGGLVRVAIPKKSWNNSAWRMIAIYHDLSRCLVDTNVSHVSHKASPVPVTPDDNQGTSVGLSPRFDPIILPSSILI